MTGLTRVAVVCAAALALSACGSARLFDAHPISDSESAAGKPWPKLVDTPEAPAKGAYSQSVPDPARGETLRADLGQAAKDAATRAERLRAPVLTEAERRRLTARH